MDKSDAAPDELRELALAGLTVQSDCFSLDLTAAPERWYGVIRRLGRKQAYACLARILCGEFQRVNGREFLFSDRCVAFELGYHMDAFLWSRGFRGCRRHITTLLFSRASLDRHCRTVEIDEKDLYNFRQRLMFRYRRGLRTAASSKTPDSGKFLL